MSSRTAATAHDLQPWHLAAGLALVLAAGPHPASAQVDDDEPPPIEEPWEDEPPEIEEPSEDVPFTPYTPDLGIKGVHVRHHAELGVLEFQMEVRGKAGNTKPEPAGSVDGAPILSYIFKTNVPPAAVGFRNAHGTLALAVSSHPDVDWSPFWDENDDGVYTNDGAVFQAHWMVLVTNETTSVARNYGVRSTLPPTAPALPLYLDSPGFNVVLDGSRLRVVVPTKRVGGRTSVDVTAMTTFMRLDDSVDNGPMLSVERVYDEYDPRKHKTHAIDRKDG